MPNTYYVAQGLDGEQIEAALEAIDGVVTPENNGKVLVVENGKIVAKSASTWTDAPVLEPVTIRQNGTTTPPTGVDGFNSVTVAVPGAGYIEPLTVTQNGTYTPPSGVDGFSPVVVNVQGGSGMVDCDYAQFDGSAFIELPFTLDADYEITVDFDALSYINDQSVIGTSVSVNRVFLTQYSNAWYTNNGSVTSFSGATTGRHIFAVKVDGLYFDGEKKLNYTPITDTNARLYLSGRASGQNFRGKIYSYKIEKISDGTLVSNLKPKKAYGLSFLFDEVSQTGYANGISYCANDE